MSHGKIDIVPIFYYVASNESGSEILPLRENVQQDETSETSIRKSSRLRGQPSYLSNYEVELNHFYILSCFFVGVACQNEPKSYYEAKGNSE